MILHFPKRVKKYGDINLRRLVRKMNICFRVRFIGILLHGMYRTRKSDHSCRARGGFRQRLLLNRPLLVAAVFIEVGKPQQDGMLHFLRDIGRQAVSRDKPNLNGICLGIGAGNEFL